MQLHRGTGKHDDGDGIKEKKDRKELEKKILWEERWVYFPAVAGQDKDSIFQSLVAATL